MLILDAIINTNNHFFHTSAKHCFNNSTAATFLSKRYKNSL
ncbi:Hypothetical protein ETEE_0773 [Edwardsiella anguillarum ET080813]|uniref:Uncharacterized protein n=1 Tax=Edwardsiella anguillarum ET080813 TaxID=667120 RepID=A0A076LNI6_9GAMM|nr:Hypothetical protein ETEE_0773 [Edwardsiella anguillarum ET080813]